MAKQDCQITFVDHTGTPQLYHPETNADQVLTGLTYRVPQISDITNWSDRSAELINARKGESNLRTKIDNIDKALQPTALLNSIKTVDGTGTGLDADKVDGKDVNDEARDTNTLWTAQKIYTELGKKVNSTEVVSEATPNKILLLNSASKLVADVQGNSDTATRWNSPVSITFNGDVAGSVSLSGNEGSASVDLQVLNDSHNHKNLTQSVNTIEAGTVNIADFKRDGSVVSSIDAEGNFTGSAKKIDGKAVSDELETGVIWTCDKITEEINKVRKEFEEGAKINEEDGTIDFGSLKVKYGTIELGVTRSQQSVQFKEPFQKVLFVNHSLETSDVSLACVKLPGEDTAGLQFLLNKPALNGKIIWFVVGM